MKRVSFPLHTKSIGDEVTTLHDALLWLLRTGDFLVNNADEAAALAGRLGPERKAARYGDFTQKIVSIFQERQQLKATGDVDEPTARALNARLVEGGALAADNGNSAQHAVAGQVRFTDGRPATAMTVVALRDDGQSLIRLAEDRSDSDGRYTIRYSPLAEITEKSALVVQARSSDGALLGSAYGAMRAVELLDLTIPSEQEVASWHVSGTVRSADHAVVPNLDVRAVDIGVGEDIVLARGATDVQGKFSLTFQGQAFQGRGKEKPDLQVQVWQGKRKLGTSEVLYDAARREQLNVVLDQPVSSAARVEHRLLTDSLAQHFKGALDTLEESDARSDISYLANKTGWDARAVAMASLASRFAKDAEQSSQGALSAPHFYALLRAGFAGDEQALFQGDPAAVRQVWKQASTDGVIPNLTAAALDQAVTAFTQEAASRSLDGVLATGPSTLRQVLDLSLRDPSQQARFSELYAAHRGDWPTFWKAAEDTFGRDTTQRLRIDGRLSYLTGNHAGVMQRIHAQGQVQDIGELVDRGLYRAEAWRELIADETPPTEIQGANETERRTRYAQVLATQLRLSYPTRVVAAMVGNGETPVSEARQVQAFLKAHHERFDIGTQPIARFVQRNQMQIAPQVQHEIARIQRVYQITPDDTSLNALLADKLDSAQAVARLDRASFVARHAERVGGAEQAALIHTRAQQVHNAVLNIAVSYASAANMPRLGKAGRTQFLNALSAEHTNASDVLAYATLEDLFGSMDYCACDHCRSILSPAAYLTDLLLFCDREGASLENPLNVLLQRRPDLEHLPLTCENTNTVLPYIDVVNETLEYYVVNRHSLNGYRGHSNDGSVDSTALLASPQFVSDAAYEVLAGRSESGPEPLLPPHVAVPFDLPLERLRHYTARFDTSLSEAMETLRVNNALERPEAGGPPAPYGWRDILMERLGLSRAMHDRITNRTHSVQTLYGYPSVTTDDEMRSALSNARTLAQTLGLTYLQLAEVLRARFVNPAAALLPLLERLGLSFASIHAFQTGAMTVQQLAEAIAPQLDSAAYGGDIGAWVHSQYDSIMRLITLVDPDPDVSSGFDAVQLRYASPDATQQTLHMVDFVRLYRFVQVWRTLGWSISQTDQALVALVPPEEWPTQEDNTTELDRLDRAMRAVLPRLATVQKCLTEIPVNPKQEFDSLLSCFASLEMHGESALYRRLFLSGTVAGRDPAFAIGGDGRALTDTNAKLEQYAETIRAACALSADDWNAVTESLDVTEATPLTLDKVSAIYRYAWLARKLRMSVRELLGLCDLSGIDPFAMPDPPDPPILKLLSVVEALREASIKPGQILPLLGVSQGSGIAPATEHAWGDFVRGIRQGQAEVERDYSIAAMPDTATAVARMSQIYDAHTTDQFFGLLNQQASVDVPFTIASGGLDSSVSALEPALSYDALRHRLVYAAGVMSDATEALLASASNAPPGFAVAVAALAARSREFFQRYPELRTAHDAYLASSEPSETRFITLLENLLPQLSARRVRQDALQRLATYLGVANEAAAALAEQTLALHAVDDAARPALDDILLAARRGLTMEWSVAPTFSLPASTVSESSETVAYGPGRQPLPSSGAQSTRWSGFLCCPESGFYNFHVDTDATVVTLHVNGEAVSLQQHGQRWSNAAPLDLAGGTLIELRLQADNLNTALALRWQTLGRGLEVVPSEYLYPAASLARMREATKRLGRVAQLAALFKLPPAELGWLATRPETHIAGTAWLNHIPVDGPLSAAAQAGLASAFSALLNYRRMRAAFKAADMRLPEALEALEASEAQSASAPNAPSAAPNLLLALTRWDAAAVDALLVHFGAEQDGEADYARLASLSMFERVERAMRLIKRMRISAPALLTTITNAPDASLVRALQSALRACYAETDWLDIEKAINDDLRSKRRDALVAYILHQMRHDPSAVHIDSEDKLFEYFLMDVAMAPCMQTSRIRHALSSVQLFVERCLMNLEPRVAPGSLNAKWWEWMRRYRVWEANRKVFLFPENWLEPELRDDKSVFFNETMSELLQGDITEDAAASAMMNYLTKLEEVARLETSGMYYASYDPAVAQDDVVHVVARTSGARRKYFHRKREYGYWTPWDPVKLEIEDDPVIPVVWKDRLLLFWVKLLKTSALNLPEVPSGGLADLDVSKTMSGGARVTLKVILCWSEFSNGKWQPAKTSDPSLPATLGTLDAASAATFDRARLSLSVQQQGDALDIRVSGQGSATFRMHNTYSSPEMPQMLVVWVTASRTLDTDARTLTATYHPGAFNLGRQESLARPILKADLSGRAVQPRHPSSNAWDMPFIYEDARHAFYVTSVQRPVRVVDWTGFTREEGRGMTRIDIPPLVYANPGKPDPVGPVARPEEIWTLDATTMGRYVTEDAHIKRGFASTGAVRFGSVEIGPAGKIGAALKQ